MPSEKPVTISRTSDTFFEYPSFVNIWVARMTCELPDILTKWQDERDGQGLLRRCSTDLKVLRELLIDY